MMHTKFGYHILFFGLVFYHVGVNAQQISSQSIITQYANGESVFHTDKPYYVSGENIWYKLYLPIALKDAECVVSVRLANSAGQVVDQYFIRATAAQASGYMILPYDIATDNYTLQFAIADGVNLAEVVVGKFIIPIYNDLNPLPTGGIAESPKNSSPKLNQQLIITIDNERVSGQPRSKNGYQFTITDVAGNPVSADISVSVYDQSLSGTSISQSVKTHPDVELAIPSNTVNNQLYTRGVVTDPNGQKLLTNVLGAWAKQENEMLYSKSDAQGQFVLKQADFYGNRPLQFIGHLFDEHDDIKVSLDKTIPVVKTEVVVNDEIENYLQVSRDRKKIFQSYKTTESIVEIEQIKKQLNQLKSNRTFKMSDYKRFKTLADFFNELLNSNLEFQEKDGVYTARMYNPQARGLVRHFTGDPIFIIDGKVTKDANYIALLDPTDIETGDLFFITKEIREQFGTFGNSAYVIIETKEGDAKVPSQDEEDIKMVNGLLAPAKFDQITDEELKNRMPIFRPQIYWNSNLKSDANGKGSFIFNHSDDLGNFRVQIVARDNDGKIGSYQTTYQVARKQ